MNTALAFFISAIIVLWLRRDRRERVPKGFAVYIMRIRARELMQAGIITERDTIKEARRRAIWYVPYNYRATVTQAPDADEVCVSFYRPGN